MSYRLILQTIQIHNKEWVEFLYSTSWNWKGESREVLIFVWRNALEYDQYNHVIEKLIIIIMNITSKQYIYKSLPMLSSLTGPAYNKNDIISFY